jgi:predicted alpha/beta-hydrolase family hydrolase
MTQVVMVVTAHGPARIHLDRSRHPLGTVVLGHGAGGGVEAPDLVALARHLPGRGLNVLRLEQPWRVAGRRVAVAPLRLDQALLDTRTAWPAGPVVVGGRSAGARVACRTASAVGASGVVALAFPLHPPARPERSRADELDQGIPTLVVQGESDPFGGPDSFPSREGLTVVPVPGNHSFVAGTGAVGTADEVVALVAELVAAWCLHLLVGNADAWSRRSRVS